MAEGILLWCDFYRGKNKVLILQKNMWGKVALISQISLQQFARWGQQTLFWSIVGKQSKIIFGPLKTNQK